MNRTALFLALVAAVVFWGAVVLGQINGFRINHTRSLPVGLWHIEQPSGPIERGQIISFCPPETPLLRQALKRGWIGYGQCSGGWEPLLKAVIAISGDHITLGETGIAVNGRSVPDSARIVLGAGEIPTGLYDLQTNQIWGLSTFHPRSFDSRYFGAITQSQIEGIATPIWVWP